MKENILFVGIGQAGGNIAYEMRERGYVSFFINTSDEDISSLNVNERYKYHIPTAQGCNKDRKKAIEYTKEYFTSIERTLSKKFPTMNKIFFCFSAGGGTGSGISPILIDIFSRQNKNKTYGAIVAMPSDEESIKTKHNSLLAFKELSKIENIGNIYLLDNNSGMDIIEINKQFADRFDSLVGISDYDSKKGRIDDYELSQLLEIKGNVTFADFKSTKEKDSPQIELDPIFVPFEGTCQYIVKLETPKNTIKDTVLEESFGKPIHTYKAVDEDEENSFITVFGLPIPQARATQLNEDVEQSKADIKFEVEDNFDLEVSDVFQTKVLKKKTKAIDSESLDDIFARYEN